MGKWAWQLSWHEDSWDTAASISPSSSPWMHLLSSTGIDVVVDASPTSSQLPNSLSTNPLLYKSSMGCSDAAVFDGELGGWRTSPARTASLGLHSVSSSLRGATCAVPTSGVDLGRWLGFVVPGVAAAAAAGGGGASGRDGADGGKGEREQSWWWQGEREGRLRWEGEEGWPAEVCVPDEEPEWHPRWWVSLAEVWTEGSQEQCISQVRADPVHHASLRSWWVAEELQPLKLINQKKSKFKVRRREIRVSVLLKPQGFEFLIQHGSISGLGLLINHCMLMLIDLSLHAWMCCSSDGL